MSDSRDRLVPAWVLWVCAGAAYGILMRLMFGLLEENLAGPMSFGFLVMTPLIVGMVTVWGVTVQELTWPRVIFLPWLSVALMMIGCALTLMEGAICIALMTPLLLTMASIGGVIGRFFRPSCATGASTLHSIAVLPLLVAFGESYVDMPVRQLDIVDTIEISAPPERVWQEIMTARDIRADELPTSLSHLIGVPKPVEGINVMTPNGEVRYSKWEKGVNFRAIVTSKQINQSISWHYEFDANFFPEGSMDDHVKIGGRFFKLDDTDFRLKPTGDGKTVLELRAHYQLSTPINFYAVPSARLLGHDFVRTILGLYKVRSERPSHG